ncbi:N-acetylglucosamine-6-phosphate deacetylase [Paenibacillus agaridevorans]|uniref:N-acetylglucosamine-6-phosphate deacetylase n=1 Tax=Paenibacillus agaridevorans TaxID=171404 RepID=UPI001BE4672D|nr:amidohydrolase family protein [Paenibacillus agaridevorans]
MPSWVGRHWKTGRTARIRVLSGRIHSVEETEEEHADVWIAPALMDLQVNGIHGVNYNGRETTVEMIAETVRYLHSCGVARFFPTITSCSQDDALSRLALLVQACEADPITDYAIVGIHMEGPYLSAEDGPRGAHSAKVMRDPDWNEFLAWEAAAKGRLRKVTVAPERKGAIEFIRRLTERGIIAAIGHTAAMEEEIGLAVDAGATMSTHLGNGAHPVLKRHPNYIWAQLGEDRLWAGLIADGFHLPPSTLKSMIRVKGSKAILVSDTNMLEGAPPGIYRYGVNDVIKDEEGRLFLAATPDIFAGSALALHEGVANIARFGIASVSEAIEMASTHAAELLGLAQDGAGSLTPGAPADFILYDSDESNWFRVRETVSQGISRYKSEQQTNQTG